MKALITGITGQDGAYLSQFLLGKDYEVVGAKRRGASANTWRLEELGILDRISFEPFELTEYSNIVRVIDKVQPDEIYNLAALSFVQTTFEQPIYTADVNGIGPVRILEAIRQVNPKIRFYQASTSEMFGDVRESPQNENTRFRPVSPYAIAKLHAHWATVNYRDAHGIHAVSGILFNHESPLRGIEFVTRKITDGLARIKLGKQDVLNLGNLDVCRDWGFAGDYVKGMWQMLQVEPDDFVLASERHMSVRDFIEIASRTLGLDVRWSGEAENEVGYHGDKEIIRVDPAFYRPREVVSLLGDASKAHSVLNWWPDTGIEMLIRVMALRDLERLA